MPFPDDGLALIKDMASAIEPNPRGVCASSRARVLSLWPSKIDVPPLRLTSLTDPAYVDDEIVKTAHHRPLYGDHYARLQAIKAQYDPGNLFRSPQSIQLPTASFSPCVASLPPFILRLQLKKETSVWSFRLSASVLGVTALGLAVLCALWVAFHRLRRRKQLAGLPTTVRPASSRRRLD